MDRSASDTECSGGGNAFAVMPQAGSNSACYAGSALPHILKALCVPNSIICPRPNSASWTNAVRILFEEFAEITARTTDPKRKAARILKVILYGSYARGDWVDDPIGGYQSDYDILVVVNDERLTDVWWNIGDPPTII
jgi:hypothetical protein